MYGGGPAEAPEFDLDMIQIIDANGEGHTISQDILKALVGDVSDKMLEDSIMEAIELGDF